MRVKIALLCLLGILFCSCLNAAYKVGIVAFDPPYVYSINEGFDIDLTKIICQRLKIQCILIPMSYNKLFTALDSGDIDFALGAIFIKPNSGYLFSLPYTIGRGQFMVLKSSSAHTVEDLKGKDIGVIKGNPTGSAFVDFLNSHYPDLFQIKDYDSINDLVTALNNQSVSAVFMRRSAVQYWTQNNASLFKSLGAINHVGSGIGVMSSLQNTNLIQQINTVLKQMEADGSYLNLYKIYFNE